MPVLQPGPTYPPTCPLGVPIGTVVAYSASLDVLPGTGWEPCDGGMITDPESPFHGQRRPMLNDHRFICGVAGPDEANTQFGSNDIPAHKHTGVTGSAGGHTHAASTALPDIAGFDPQHSFQQAGDQMHNHTHVVMVNAVADHFHTIATEDGRPDGNIPASLGAFWIIRVR